MAKAKKTEHGHLLIQGLRCSFPQLWQEDVQADGSKFGKGIKLLLCKEKDADAIKLIKSEISRIMKEKPKIAEVVKKSGESKMCLKDGDREEYGDVKMLNCGNPKTIMVMHKNATPATEADDPIYSGCMVNAKVEIWGQDNKYGKRINAKIIAVQFAGDAASFDGGHVAPEVAADGFESLEDDDFGGSEDAATPEDDDFDF